MSITALEATVGNLKLENPTVLASGVQGPSLLRTLEALRLGAGAAVTKSVGPRRREGYADPVTATTDSGLVNAVGLPNPGAEAFARELASVKARSPPLIVSVFGASGGEFGGVVSALDGNNFLAYELNLSCPHVEGVGTEVGHDPELVADVVKLVKRRTSKNVFVKLSPNTEKLLEVARAAVDAGADGLTATNTVRAMTIDIESERPGLSNVFGGLSGGAIRPIALRCVYELHRSLDVPIMGCGGVSTWEHAVQFILAGASAVQIGTATLQRYDIFNEVNLGITSYMERKGVSGLDELVGRAHERS
ncbi:MAG: dihydroorotate dehydrogenase [Nitrososphaerales archaeon]|nr:dihydroorotate dehydrogenase [Nitrososphaerales archaeon]